MKQGTQLDDKANLLHTYWMKVLFNLNAKLFDSPDEFIQMTKDN